MRIRQILPLALIAIAISVFLASDSTQTSSAPDTLQRDSEQIAGADFEEFRGRLATLFADLEEAYPNVVAAGGPHELLEQITEARQLIPELTAEELWVLRDAISQYPAYWDIPTVISLSLEPGPQDQAPQDQAPQASTGSLMSHTCPAPAGGGFFTGPQKHIQNEFLQKKIRLSTKAKALLLEAVAMGIPEPLNLIPVAAWLFAEEVVLAEELIILGTEEKNAINDECEEDVHRAIMHDVVGPAVLDLESDLANHDTNIDGDLIAHDTNIDGDLIIHDGDIKGLIGGVQETLDTTTEMKRVHLQIIALPGGREFLITADEAGVPVDVEFIAVRYSRGNDPISFVDVLADSTVTTVSPGVHHVEISKLKGSPIDSRSSLAVFEVRHDHGSYTHFGIIVVN
ncbi:MAG: hypothetical protein IIA90_04500 [Chloroflexi bacterium]|nr:hypothetical protein [Chloroflexota bacterium]